jgi:hypothetical protein
MEWLEANQGEAPPTEVEPAVIEAVYALRPDLAPKASVDVSMILDKIESGPFATSREGAEEDSSNLVSLSEARKRNRIWGALGLVAAAAMVMIVVVPLRNDEAVTRAPVFLSEEAPPAARGVELSRRQEGTADRQVAESAPVSLSPQEQATQPRPGLPTPLTDEVEVATTSSKPTTRYNLDRPERESTAIAVPPSEPEVASEPNGGTVGGFGQLEQVMEFEDEELYGGAAGASMEPRAAMEAGAAMEAESAPAPMMAPSASQSGSLSSGSASSGFGRRSRSEVAEVQVDAVSDDAVDNDSAPLNEVLLSAIEAIEELIQLERFDEALVATQANRPLATDYSDLLKQLWLQESQALTGLGRLDEAALAIIEAEKL